MKPDGLQFKASLAKWQDKLAGQMDGLGGRPLWK